MLSNFSILDCTLRDGGFCLEDAVKNGCEDARFKDNDIEYVSEQLSESKIDILEIGAIEISKENKENLAISQDIESISKRIPKNRKSNQLFAAMYRGPDTSINEIPVWHDGLIDVPRVILRYSELKKSLEFCNALSEKGYKVAVQPMVTMRYTDDEIDMVIDATNQMNAFALYFVDSYGYMMEDDVLRLFNKYEQLLKPNIAIGFHAHNNMNMAFANVVTVLKQNTSRKVIVDSCVTGIGQGAGNLQTEVILPYVNNNFSKNYEYDPILNCCDIIEKYNPNLLWGYSVSRLLPAINKVAYKYSVALRNQYKLKYSVINKILKNIPEELRHRYTPDNTKKLLEINDLL